MFWLIAKILSIPFIVNLLIKRATKTPYLHIVKQGNLYMARYWLLNPYSRSTGKPRFKWFPWSMRLHFIMRPDDDCHMHDHPWNARTFILRGGYREVRPDWNGALKTFERNAGDTAKLNFGEFHKITAISPGGVTTLFISGPYRGIWGYLVNGGKVDWRTYLAEQDPGYLKSDEEYREKT